jgi:hypothetical protein
MAMQFPSLWVGYFYRPGRGFGGRILRMLNPDR